MAKRSQSMKTGASRSSLVLVLALVVVSWLCSTLTTAQTPVLLQVSGYVTMPADEKNSGTAQNSASTALQWCTNNGAALIADSRMLIAQTIQTMCMNEGQELCTMFLDGNAKPRAGSTNGCVSGVRDTTSTPNSMRCTYRWRLGFYDTYAETYGPNGMIKERDEYEPGLCYFKGLYADTTGYTGRSQFCNGFVMERVWNSSTALNRLAYPRGKYQVIAGTTATRYFRMDTDETAVNNNPNPLSSYTVYCYLQDYPLPAPWTNKPAQPDVIPGYKELTWAQSHWWVIFLIVALVILAILIFIIIYCAVTSRPAKEQSFLPTLVQREREGRRYVYAEDEELEKKDGDGDREVPPPMPSQPMQDYMDPNETPQQRAMRLGRGFNIHDPENALRGNSAIYGAADLAQHGENTSLAGDEADRIAAEEALYNLGARQLDAAAQKKPEPAPAPEPEPSATSPTKEEPPKEEELSVADPEELNADSHAPSIRSRRSARRSRGRTSSQTFSEIEVPQGDEINEMNIEL